MGNTSLEERIKKLLEVCELMERDGNWNYDAYMQGMTNGLIYARHLLSEAIDEPPFKSPPERWISGNEPTRASQEEGIA